jgi:riboflavin synthase
MFTGIITAIGTIRDVQQIGDTRAVIACPFDPATIAIGASIACSGVCLTVVDRGGIAGDAWFAVDISAETMACSIPGLWAPGRHVNLEGALKLGDELGGHIVTGHVDGTGTVLGICAVGTSRRIGFAISRDLAPYLAAKGSITIDGVSLTVNEVTDQADGTTHFAVNIIPHTAEVTTLGALAAGDKVNLEIDVLARYLMRMQSLRNIN